MNCKTCDGDGGWYINPDYPMGDCGARQWEKCPCGTDNPVRRQELWTETNRAYSIARYGTPTG